MFGISSGGVASKDKFISTNKLSNTELLIDENDKVRNEWAVPKALFGALPGRVTYVVGKDGNIASIFDDLINAELHPKKAIATLDSIVETVSVQPKKKGPFGF